MDLFIRDHSGGKASLDELLRQLYRDYPLGSGGYTEENLRHLVSRLAGKDSAAFFEAYIQGTAPLELEAALAAVGMNLSLEGDKEDSAASDQKAFLGVSLRGTSVSSVASDGPAFQAGLIAGDEIVALDGRRLDGGQLAKRLESYTPGETIELSFFRRDKLRTLKLVLAGRPRGQWTVSLSDEVTPLQRTAFEAWTGQSWPGDDREKEQ